MDDDKRKVIIHEIEHWRKSRLLPEHYCDFLLNLYDAPAASRDSLRDSRSGGAGRLISGKALLYSLAGVGVALLVAVIVFYFTAFAPAMQIMSALVIVGVCFGIGLTAGKNLPALRYSFVGAGAIGLLAFGVWLLRLHQLDEPPLLAAYIACCSFVWMIVGFAARMGLFHYCGWAGLLLLYAWLLNSRVELDWVGAQVSWLPLCLLFGWLGWLFHKGNKSTGAVLLMVGFTLWWMPELYGWATGGIAIAVIQLLLMVKLCAAGIVLFAFRKKWMKWVF